MNPTSPAKRLLLGALRPFLGSGGEPPPIPERARRILVVRQHDQLGDIILSLPVLEALRKRYPDSEITIVTRPPASELMDGHPCLDRVLASEGNAVASLRSLYPALTDREYDIAIVPSTVSVSLTSNLIARFSGARVRIGPGSLEGVQNPSAYLFTHPLDLRWPPGRHQTLRNLDILAPLGIAPEPTASPVAPLLGGMDDLAARAEEILSEFRTRGVNVVGIHPGAAKPQNRWPVESYAALADRFLARGWGAIVTIGPRDEEVYAAIKGRLNGRVRFLVRQPLRLVAAVVDRLDFFISNDTGVLHMAGALRVPTLGLYGPTEPGEWAAPGAKNRQLRGAEGDVSRLSVEEVFNCFFNRT